MLELKLVLVVVMNRNADNAFCVVAPPTIVLIAFPFYDAVRECGSTLYVGMPQKQNGHPYNAMESDHCKTHQQARSNLQKPPKSCF